MTSRPDKGVACRRRIAGLVTGVAAVGSGSGWLLATVFEYLQWARAARWTLHLTVVLVGLMAAAALAAWVWRDEAPPGDASEGD